MIRQQYLDFVEKFAELSPFELDHFSRTFHQHYSSWCGQQSDSNHTLSSGELQEILIDTVWTVHSILAERKVEEAKLNLANLRTKYYRDD